MSDTSGSISPVWTAYEGSQSFLLGQCCPLHPWPDYGGSNWMQYIDPPTDQFVPGPSPSPPTSPSSVSSTVNTDLLNTENEGPSRPLKPIRIYPWGTHARFSPSGQPIVPPQKGPKRWRCPAPGCGMEFPKESACEIHIRSHTKVQPYWCEHCGHRFSLKSNLRRHHKTCKSFQAASRSSDC